VIEQQAVYQHRQAFMARVTPPVKAQRLTRPPEGGRQHRLYEELQEAYTGHIPRHNTYEGNETNRTAYILDSERNWANAKAMLQDTKSLDVPIVGSSGETDGVTPLDRLQAPSRTPEQIVQSHEGFEALLADLPEEDKRIMRMRYRDGFRQKEIGAEFGITEGGMGTRIRKILLELRGE